MNLPLAAPVRYTIDCAHQLSKLFDPIKRTSHWEQRSDARMECFFSDWPESYTYGSGAGKRTYHPDRFTFEMDSARYWASAVAECEFDVCFNNYYLNQHNALGWHADDSDSLDPAAPIAVVSLGAAREIWFRKIPQPGQPSEIEKLMLEPGSVLIMLPGMQQTHQHRIPKAGRECGERISLTFRKLKR